MISYRFSVIDLDEQKVIKKLELKRKQQNSMYQGRETGDNV